MRIPVTAVLAVFVSAGLLQTSPPSSDILSSPLPDRDVFMARVRSAVRLDEDLQRDFTYVERRRDVKVSPLGRVSVGPLRTFEVFPALGPTRKYKRLIAIEGEPLDPVVLQRRDAEHQRDLDNDVRKQSRETPAQQARRLERAARERRENLTILADAPAAFGPSLISRDIVDGEVTIVVALTPRANARPATREGGWMKQFQGRAWFAEEDGQLARLDMHATDDVSIGWGIVGRLHKGSRIVVERQRLGRQWLPARLTFEATGRTLMFRPFELKVVTEYTDYRGK